MSVDLPPLLFIDDERNMRLSMKSVLEDEGYDVETAESAELGLRLLAQQKFFMVITDAQLTGMSGYGLLTVLKRDYPGVPALMITAYATPKLAVEALKAGATDYLPKPFAPEELLHAVRRCAGSYQLLAENQALRQQVTQGYRLDHIIGESPKVVELRRLIQTVAPSKASVLILGESGTGKELVAGALHCLSPCAAGPYVRINCAAIQETLLESELFGHEKGAFTGAIKQKPGRVEEADGGTIFLDEIGDMSRALQAKLLRFLEDGTFTRVGGTEELKVDVRLLAATNRDIIEAIRNNSFREDLYHRLNVVQLRLPPLRDRGRDIMLLAEYFLVQYCHTLGKPIARLSKGAEAKLLVHHWPGNVRELRNVIERAVILEDTAQIQPTSLPDFELETRLRKSGGKAEFMAAGLSLDEAVAAFEREVVHSTLVHNNYSINKTAEQLKVTRHALRYRMQRLNINTEGGPGDAAEPQPAAQE